MFDTRSNEYRILIFRYEYNRYYFKTFANLIILTEFEFNGLNKPIASASEPSHRKVIYEVNHFSMRIIYSFDKSLYALIYVSNNDHFFQ